MGEAPPGCDDCEMRCHDHPMGITFCRFHEENPHVYERLRDMALKMLRNGHNIWGIRSMFVVLRFQADIETTGDSFKINERFAPWYARLLMRSEPELRGFFSLKKAEADIAFAERYE